MLLSKAEEKSQLSLEILNLKLLRFTNGYTQLKEVAKGVAVNGPGFAQLRDQNSVSLADAVENEDKAFCFAIHDPTTRQPEKPKLGFALKTMLANVRPNCDKRFVMCSPVWLCLEPIH